MAERKDWRLRLPKLWADLPWKKINWALHSVWAIAILLLLNSCGGIRKMDSLSVSLTILEIVIVIALAVEALANDDGGEDAAG